MKIRIRILLLMSLGALVPLLISHWFSYKVYSREFRDNAEQGLLVRGDQFAGRVNDRVNWILETTAMVVGAVPFENFAADELSEALSIPDLQLSFTNLVVLLNSSGGAVVAPYRPKPGTEELLDRPPVSDAELSRFSKNVPLQLSLTASIAIGPLFFSDDGHPRVVVAKSFDVGEGKKWVLAVGVMLDSLCVMADEVERGSRTTFGLFDGRGQSFCGDSPDAGIGAKERAALRSGKIAIIGQGESSFVALVSDVALTGWRICQETPQYVAFSRFESILRGLVMWIGISLAVALSGGILLSRALTRPIGELLSASRRVAGGNFNEQIPVTSSDEIGELSTSFNIMTTEICRWNRELSDRVEKNTRDLRDAQEQIIRTQKLAAVGELGAGVAHEINNPLTGVLGNAQLLLTMIEENSPMREIAEEIALHSRRVADVVDALLRFSQKQWDETMLPVSPKAIWENVVSLYGSRIADARVQVEWRRIEELRIRGAEGSLQVAFSNLLDNSLQSMGEGGKITLDVAGVEGGAVMVSIADTGSGMTEDVRQRAVDPFFSTQAPGSGRKGLGLATVHRVASAHEARVVIQSRPGEGTVVVLYFPGMVKLSKQ